MKHAITVLLSLLTIGLLGMGTANAVTSDQPPTAPTLSSVNTATCGVGGAVVTATQRVFVAASAEDPDSATVSITLTLATADRRQQLGRITRQLEVDTVTGYQVPSSQRLQTGHKYAVRAVVSDGTHRSGYSPWCYFLVDNRVPTVPQQTSDSFGTTYPKGQVGQRGQVTISGGGPATARYQWTAEPDFIYTQECVDYTTFGTDCTTRGAAVAFAYKPRATSFQICVRAVSRTGLESDGNCQTYHVNPAG